MSNKQKLTDKELEEKYEDMLNHTFFKDIANRMEEMAKAIDRIEMKLFGEEE